MSITFSYKCCMAKLHTISGVEEYQASSGWRNSNSLSVETSGTDVADFVKPFFQLNCLAWCFPDRFWTHSIQQLLNNFLFSFLLNWCTFVAFEALPTGLVFHRHTIQCLVLKFLLTSQVHFSILMTSDLALLCIF